MNFNHKTIVVTFLMHLGDVVLTSPFLQVLRRVAPDSTIIYVMDEKLKEVMMCNPNIDHVVTVDKKGKDNSMKALATIARKIRDVYHPDMVINLHPNERTSYLAWKIGAPYTTGMSHFMFRLFMDKYTRLDRRNFHAADMYCNVLTQLGVDDVSNQGLEIATHPDWEAAATLFYEQQGVSATDTVIGFNVGSAVPEKRWPKERFAAVADALASQGYKTVFFGGPMDEEMVQDVVQQMKTQPIIATGKFTLGPLAAAIRRCQLFITNDSGPMHIAVSQHVPIVALYGPSNPKYYGPYQANAIVLESMDTYDETKNMKQVLKEGSYKGLQVITTEQVMEAAKQLLENQRNANV